MLEHPLPHSAESERAILGAIILDNQLLAQAAAKLSPTDFYVRANQLIFAAMLDIGDGQIDPITLGEQLRKQDKLEQVGGISFISELTYGLPHFCDLRHYAAHVLEKSALRSYIRLGSQLVNRALEADAEAKDVGAWADEVLRLLGQQRADLGFRSFDDVAEEAADIYARMYRNDVLTVPTGFPEIDDGLTGRGFNFTSLVIIAGKASHGKTAFALDVAINAARLGFPPAVASLEMEDTSLFMRAHSAESGVERWKMRSGIYEPEFRRLVATLEKVRSLPVYVSHHISSVEDFCRQARELVRNKGVRLLLVDYLQLLTTEERHGSRNNEVGSIARRLKNLALQLQVPVIALSQLSRDHDKGGREPELRDLRDSGEIEQHADTVFLLYGDKPEEGATFREVKIKCAKQREGKLFSTSMTFNGELLTFRPVMPAQTDDATKHGWYGDVSH